MKKITCPGSDRIYQELQQRFGFCSFRFGQEDIVSDILAGGVRLAVLPTGGGKTLCYLLPAALLPGKTVVVSPLIALMEDQRRRAEQAGFPTVIWRGLVRRQNWTKPGSFWSVLKNYQNPGPVRLYARRV